jgi:uncharacterized protein YbaA (DUF1428 family)
MAYVEGFVLAVPAAKKEIYLQHAAHAAPLFKEFGATRMVEAWGDEVPDGEVTDFRRTVKAEPDEVVVFSWIEYPDKATRDVANAKIMTDPRMEEMGKEMPFDGKRMIFGGFAPLVDDGSGGRMGYVDGSLMPAPAGAKEAYRAMAARTAAIFREHGAVRVVDAWADDVPDGEVTDFKGAVQASGDEKVVYCWVEWPSKDVRDAGWAKVMSDPRMELEPDSLPADGQRRRVYGGFAPLLDA